jgi:N-dimethylarginine dimethylaminohydrolase
MTRTHAGSDRPSTLGGPGWMPRGSSHRDDVITGRLWTRCGYRSETDRLCAVLLAMPPATVGDGGDPDARLMLGSLDLDAMRAQTSAVAEAYRRNGVRVHLEPMPDDVSPNVIFMRDLFFMTPGGAVVARMASAQRAGEERHAARVLAARGYPILRTVAGRATFEGADALWLDRDTVLVGVGFRTNADGAREVRQALADHRVTVIEVPLGQGVQHLLGSVVFLDERLTALHAAAATDDLRALLADRGHRLVDFEPDREVVSARGLNLLALGPGQVLMPAGAPGIRRRLEEVGVRVQEVEIGEYVKAAGGLGCMTGILLRDRPTDRPVAP